MKGFGYVMNYNRLSNKINDKFMLDLFRRRKPTRILQRLPTALANVMKLLSGIRGMATVPRRSYDFLSNQLNPRLLFQFRHRLNIQFFYLLLAQSVFLKKVRLDFILGLSLKHLTQFAQSIKSIMIHEFFYY
jgi:hypothetical protein